jgi:HSP20 family molecular chaperone IbpA
MDDGSRPGASHWRLFDMIDDEFESVFRRLFESLMNSMGTMPEGETTIRYWTNSGTNNPGLVSFPGTDIVNEPQAEIIDLDDKVLFLVEVGFEDELIDVKVEERTLKIFNQVEGKETEFNLDFDVDIEQSKSSCRNGILEIELKKAEDIESPNEGYLRID